MNAQDRLIGAVIWTLGFLIVALASLGLNNTSIAAGLIIGAMAFDAYSLYLVIIERRKTLKR
jgi:predicted membrane-bound spermidine synthase